MYNADAFETEKMLLDTNKISRNVINQMLFLSGLDLEEEFNELFDKIKDDIENCNYNLKKLESIYENDMLKMSENFEDSLEKYIKGDGLLNFVFVPLKYCNTINDMLHYLHFYVINNKNIISSMNVLEEKNINEYSSEGYRLYGKESKEARDIFNNLPEDEDRIDEVSFNNHILLMVRGRGHALSIDIQTEDENNYRVSYIIPKVCNVEMVNKLKGVKKLDPNINNQNDSTHGEFICKKEYLVNEIIDFIKKTPTDDNLPSNLDKDGVLRRIS